MDGRSGVWRPLLVACAGIAACCGAPAATPDAGSDAAPHLTAISLSPLAATIDLCAPVPHVLMLGSLGRLSDGTSGPLSEQDVIWRSQRPLVARVDSTGVVVGLSTGTTRITVAAIADPAVSAGSTIDVVSSDCVVRIVLYPRDVRLSMGATAALSALGEYCGGLRQDVAARLSWSSSAPSVVSVDPDGTVHALAEGHATVHAHLGDIADEVVIDVTGSMPDGGTRD